MTKLTGPTLTGATLMAEETALARLGMLYAHAVDRHDADLFLTIFAEDASLETPINKWTGHAELRNIPIRVGDIYQSTLHTVMNQHFEIDADTAEGETYCVAYHLFRPEDGKQKRADWAIRYQDRYVRRNGRWLFTYRQLVVDWIETTFHPVAPT